MPVNAMNFVVTKTILDDAVGDRPTDDQTAAMNRYSAVSALLPPTTGLIVPFVAKPRIVAQNEGIWADSVRLASEAGPAALAIASEAGQTALSIVNEAGQTALTGATIAIVERFLSNLPNPAQGI